VSVFKWPLIILAVVFAIKEIFFPLTAAALYSFEFMDRIHECDSAMEAHWYETSKKDETQHSLTVELLSCHEYDLVRKKLLISGLPEEYLSWLGLKALEINQRSPEEFVRQHKFTER